MDTAWRCERRFNRMESAVHPPRLPGRPGRTRPDYHRRGPMNNPSRRQVLVGGAALAAVASLPTTAFSDTPTSPTNSGVSSVNTITTKDGTRIYYKDWGTGQPVVFSHGWPLSADAWEDQMFFLASRGYRCIAHDRRGHGRRASRGPATTWTPTRRPAAVVAVDLRTRSMSATDRRRRGRPVHRPARHQAGREGGPDLGHPAADAEDGGQPGACRSRCSTASGRVPADRSQFYRTSPPSTGPTGRTRRYRGPPRHVLAPGDDGGA